ncbi:hypothetical protein [Sorangium sp. So ce1182]|uniref:hypothetical protein n=1 Tax=Sorangium sp. So ce1182 TaxID=3133334 RepID=UPI003F5D92E6
MSTRCLRFCCRAASGPSQRLRRPRSGGAAHDERAASIPEIEPPSCDAGGTSARVRGSWQAGRLPQGHGVPG